MRTFVGAKLHGVRVTDKSVEYNGSVSICPELMRRAGIMPFERVSVVNLMTGGRWDTYALPAEQAGAFTLNGGGARLGEKDDRCVVMTWRQEEVFTGAKVLFLGPGNVVVREQEYR